MKTVTIISKEDCSLCDKALDALYAVQREIPFEIEVIKVVPGTEEYEQHKENIPVIMISGTEISRYRVDVKKLKEKISD
jgi:glutaredoxin